MKHSRKNRLGPDTNIARPNSNEDILLIHDSAHLGYEPRRTLRSWLANADTDVQDGHN